MSKIINRTDILSYLEEHYSEFKTKYNVEQIGLFGSYARNEESEDSDINIFVKMKSSLFDLIAIKDQIENDLHKRVDIIREHKNIKPILLRTIKKDLINVKEIVNEP
ncbi:MAG: nucleotidyltransferase domain-containing protein [Campylobacteraceae bacterium]|nr:nucleotidyltransferase domain-containing protein [Campylobacteraceae bacterium]